MDDSINGSDYGILNWDSPTRVPTNAGQSSPDVSLASTSLITSCSWQTLSTLSSNHLPILIRLQMKTTTTPGLRRTYVNLKKANWDRAGLSEESTSLYEAYKKKYMSNPFDSTTLDIGNELISKMAAENKRRWEEMITSIDLTGNSRKA